MMGGIIDGHRAGADLEPAPASDGHFLEASWDNYFYTRQWNTPPEFEVIVMPSDERAPGRRRRGRRRRDVRRRGLRVRPGHRHGADELPDQPRRAVVLRRPSPSCPPIAAVARPNGLELTPTEEHSHARSTPSSSTAKPVTVDVADDVRAAVGAARPPRASPAPSTAAASTSARPAPPTSTARRSTRARCRSADIRPDRRGHHDRGPADTVGADLHPMQEAWLEHDVAQCGYCQPGQIMAAVALVKQGPRGGPRDHRRRPRRDPQHLPLRHLHPHPRGHPRRRGPDVRRVTAPVGFEQVPRHAEDTGPGLSERRPAAPGRSEGLGMSGYVEVRGSNPWPPPCEGGALPG